MMRGRPGGGGVDTFQDSEAQKRTAARAALEFVEPGSYLGVGTGSTAAHFVRELAAAQVGIKGAVPSSEATAVLLREHGLPVVDLVDVGRLPVYVDGADEADSSLHLIKGGGGAATREKIVACSSDLFVCIIDESKLVDAIGTFPVAVEVIPMALVHVQRRALRIGGHAHLREGFVTDNGNLILDVHGLDLTDPVAVERTLDGIAGVVANGVFARRPADVLLVGTPSGTERFDRARSAASSDWP